MLFYYVMWTERKKVEESTVCTGYTYLITHLQKEALTRMF